jgi:hypothetical protein
MWDMTAIARFLSSFAVDFMMGATWLRILCAAFPPTSIASPALTLALFSDPRVAIGISSGFPEASSDFSTQLYHHSGTISFKHRPGCEGRKR